MYMHIHICMHTATHCNILQNNATHCNTLQHNATHCNTLQYTLQHIHTLEYTATHTATHFETHTATHDSRGTHAVESHGHTLQHTATLWKHCSTDELPEVLDDERFLSSPYLKKKEELRTCRTSAQFLNLRADYDRKLTEGLDHEGAILPARKHGRDTCWTRIKRGSWN